MSPPHIMILAGEASGDAHAAEFVECIRELQPEVRLSGMGSSEMAQAGVEVFFDSAIISVVGLVEVLKHWGDIKRAMTLVKQTMEDTRPDLLILVDYPEFNLKMARHARSLGIKVLFYISPQVWAWRPKRIHKIGRLIDHMAVIFKFESAYYERAGIPVSFVGHPLVDKVVIGKSGSELRQILKLPQDAQVVGLFPGSRNSEIARLMPVMLDTARLMLKQNPALKFVLPVAATLDYDAIEAECKAAQLDIQLTRGNLYEIIPCCDAIASCSGTVTLEIALLEVPMCIVYKMSWLSYQIMSRLITIPHIGLVNIVANRGVVRELLQQHANPEEIAAELFQILDDAEYRNQIKRDLESVRENLGQGEGSLNMARLALSFIAEPAAKP